MRCGLVGLDFWVENSGFANPFLRLFLFEVKNLGQLVLNLSIYFHPLNWITQVTPLSASFDPCRIPAPQSTS